MGSLNRSHHLVRSPLYREYIRRTISGTTITNINQKFLSNLPIILPLLQEQKAIVKILSDLDLKIELLQKQNKTLEFIGQALFKHWFIDFEFPNEEGKPYKSSGGEMVYSEELEKEIPKGWEAKNLKQLTKNFDSKRIPLSKRERVKRKGNYPYYGATGIVDFVDDYIFDGIYVLMGEDGTVIDEKGYPILQYVWGKFWTNNHTHVLQGKVISNEFLLLLLKHTNVYHIVTGAVQPKINQNNMNNLKFAISPMEILDKFGGFIKSIFSLYRKNRGEINTLSQIRDTLLPKLMSGKIRVKVPEKEATT